MKMALLPVAWDNSPNDLRYVFFNPSHIMTIVESSKDVCYIQLITGLQYRIEAPASAVVATLQDFLPPLAAVEKQKHKNAETKKAKTKWT